MLRFSDIGLKHSITLHLLKKVFAVYLIFALVVTLFHMIVEYNYEKDETLEELRSIREILQPSLSTALWYIDNVQLHSTLQGMIQQPSLVGVKLEIDEEIIGIGTFYNEENEIITLNLEGTRSSVPEYTNLFSYQFPILYDYEGTTHHIGTAFLYSSHSVVLQKIKYRFLLIMINAAIKTVALWVIFLVVGWYFLNRPLGALTNAVEQLNLDNLESFEIQAKIPPNTELKILEDAFKAMAVKLSLSRKKLEESYESLRQADKMISLGVLVTGMAHEVNNPNNFIRINNNIIKKTWKDAIYYLKAYDTGNNEMMLNGMTLDYAEENIPILIEGIEEGSYRISEIVKNLKDYARNTPTDLTGMVDINQVVDAALQLLQNLLQRSTRHLVVNQAENIPMFRGDTNRIEQVVINILHNACDALESDEKSIRILTTCEDEYVVLKIEDEGVGIAPDHLHQICDPFFTTKQDSNGTGLGLSISAGIVKEHQGHMEFISSPGNGTMVTLKFSFEDNLHAAL